MQSAGRRTTDWETKAPVQCTEPPSTSTRTSHGNAVDSALNCSVEKGVEDVALLSNGVRLRPQVLNEFVCFLLASLLPLPRKDGGRHVAADMRSDNNTFTVCLVILVFLLGYYSTFCTLGMMRLTFCQTLFLASLNSRAPFFLALLGTRRLCELRPLLRTRVSYQLLFAQLSLLRPRAAYTHTQSSCSLGL